MVVAQHVGASDFSCMHKDTSPISVHSGQIEFLKINAVRWEWRDIYHWLLTLTWTRFIGVLLALYLTVNLAFAVLYHLGDHCVAELPPDSFSGAFFFSAETLATVGYGHTYPATFYGHVVATAEILLGMFGLAVVTGLVFVRFSRPVARLVFSETMVLSNFDGVPALMLRVANLRHQAMAEAEFRMTAIRDERVKEGDMMRRFYPLHLQVEHVIIFPAALTVRHIIDAKSPLYGMSPADFERSDLRVFASVVGIDTIMAAPVQSSRDYNWRQIRFGHRFVEIYNDIDSNRYTVDYGRLHDTESAEGALPEQRV
jgi:inward rectifier potassium channel